MASIGSLLPKVRSILRNAFITTFARNDQQTAFRTTKTFDDAAIAQCKRWLFGTLVVASVLLKIHVLVRKAEKQKTQQRSPHVDLTL